jgi:hypothetical protein
MRHWRVWAFSMGIPKIPEFHPRVVKVELLSGKALREPGISYQCYLSGGKHTCVEKDIKILPMQKIVTVLPEDTFGINKISPDYLVETMFHRVGHSSTKVENQPLLLDTNFESQAAEPSRSFFS